MDAVFSLPMGFLHRDVSTGNLMVDSDCELVGILDWVEAKVCPFGQDLHFLHNLTCVLDLDTGWRPYGDFESLHRTFWDTFRHEVGATLVSDGIVKTIKTASMTGLLIYHGFTRRLACMPRPVPISVENEAGRYSMMYLDGFLISPSTRIRV